MKLVREIKEQDNIKPGYRGWKELVEKIFTPWQGVLVVEVDYGENYKKRNRTVTSFSPPGSCGFSLPQGFPSCWRIVPSFRDNYKEKA